MDAHSIFALHGASKVNLLDVVPAFSKGKLFGRDRLTCAYCGQRFNERDMQCEHIVPESRGGG
jgi:5-methylcytosine-specific restriction endonuclease McrA